MGWKKVQSKIKNNKINKLALAVLGIVLGLIILSWCVRFTKFLLGSKNYTWDREFNINLIIRTPDVSLFSYNPEEKKITILKLPDQTYMEVPGGFGSWQLRSIHGLGESEGKDKGYGLLESAVGSFLGVPVDGFLDFTKKGDANEIIDILRTSPFSGIGLFSGLKTNLTPIELIRLKMAIYGVRFDKVKIIDLVNFLAKDKLTDGQEVFIGDPVKLDSVIAGLSDPVIFSEHISVAVLNATGIPQLAQKWARVITNLGGNVIIMANAPEKLNKTQIIGKESKTFDRLGQIFALSDKIRPESTNMTTRAEINLIIGEDYTK